MTEETTAQSPKYPEHEKLATREAEHQAICEFVEWLEEFDVYITEAGESAKWPKTEHAIAAFFNIDIKAFEKEKKQMLAMMRKEQRCPTNRKPLSESQTPSNYSA